MPWGVAAAGIGAAGALGGGAMGKSGAGNASKAQQFAAMVSASTQAQLYQNSAQLQAPFVANGSMAAGMLGSILGSGGAALGQYGLPGTLGYQTPDNLQAILNNPQYQTPSYYQSVLQNPTFAPTQQQLEQTPGYQWNLNQALQGAANSNAAKGKGISGQAMQGAAAAATALAQNTLGQQAAIFGQNYQNAVTGNQQGQNIFNTNFTNAQTANAQRQAIFQANLQNIIGPLSGLESLGENGAAMTGNQGVQAGQGIGNSLMTGGGAAASGIIGGANAAASGLTGATNSIGNTLMLQSIMGNNGPLSGFLSFNSPNTNALLSGAGDPATLQTSLGLGGDQYVP